MSIRYGLLALLERGPMYGYQLRSAFEESIGATWPLNIGQVYTTLGRLVRDELVESLPEHEAGQRPYRSPRPVGPSWWAGSRRRSAGSTGPGTN